MARLTVEEMVGVLDSVYASSDEPEVGLGPECLEALQACIRREVCLEHAEWCQGVSVRAAAEFRARAEQEVPRGQA